MLETNHGEKSSCGDQSRLFSGRKEETSSADECRPGQHHKYAVLLNSVLHHVPFNLLYVFLPST